MGGILLEQSASTITRTSMELGGNAPFIVFEDADLDKAATGLMQSKLRNSGQTCVCANRIFVQDSVYAEFMEKFKAKLAKVKIGNPLDADTTVGPLIHQQAHKKCTALADSAVSAVRAVVMLEVYLQATRPLPTCP